MAGSVTKEFLSMVEYPREGVFSKVVVKTDVANVTLMCMAKGSDISSHTSTREAAVTVLEGKGTFTLGVQKIPMKPGTFIFMPKNAPHALNASENLAFVLCLFGKD